MGELLGALLAIPLIRRIRILGPYENMVGRITVLRQSGSALPGTGYLLRIFGPIIKSDQLFNSLRTRLSHRTDDLVIMRRTGVTSDKVGSLTTRP
jgi:hypothetical protein